MQTRDPNRVLIFDTTLRDGEQSPGCSMTQPEKLRVARALAELGVDIIEAGFPAASRGDWESVQSIARQVQGPVIAGLARCNEGDIDKAWTAIEDAARPRLHVFLATSAIHREHKLKMAKEEIIRTAREGVQLARARCEDVEFSPEDASRTELEFLAEVVEAAIEAGATTINVPDTVGYTVPEEFFEVFQYLIRNVHGADRVVFSVHCHDDLGMAVANSLAAVRAGARQIECTINGIGERAGNCSLEEVVMALKTRESLFGLHTGIDTRRLFPTSRLLSSITGMPIPRNKAVVGENAFAHESGIHQHGMLRHHSTYEIMRPADVGMSRTNLVLGKHSGRHAFRDRVRELGFELDEDELNRVFEDFKALADKKKELFDGDIEALVLRADADTARGERSLLPGDGARDPQASRRPGHRTGGGRRRTGGCGVQGHRDGDRSDTAAAEVRSAERVGGRGRAGRGRRHGRAQRSRLSGHQRHDGHCRVRRAGVPRGGQSNRIVTCARRARRRRAAQRRCQSRRVRHLINRPERRSPDDGKDAVPETLGRPCSGP